jgi:acyl-CoA reductase-like NAD-dependent aldehyde dehydrogenase
MTVQSDAPVSTPLLIAGEERPGGNGTFPVQDPGRRGAVVGYAAAASAADAEAAVRAAHEAWPAWAALPVAERTAMTLKALEGLDADAGERAGILSWATRTWTRPRSAASARPRS